MEPIPHIDTIEERFLVHGRMEILALLNELIYRCEPVSVDFGGNASFETRLLEAREHVLVFEACANDDLNARLAAAPGCTFHTRPEGIQVLFASARAQPVSWGGCAAFSVPLPQRLARLQRQENLRTIVTPQQAPGVALYGEDDMLLGRWPLRDLSAGGLGVEMDSQDELDLAAKGMRVRLELPGYMEVDCAVSVRHATRLEQQDGAFAYRLGLGFAGLSEEMRVAILRYIVDVERARREAPPDHDAKD